ncbi:MAG: hypothetical protein AB7O48_04505 [Cyclobacteriaceae bacterium]
MHEIEPHYNWLQYYDSSIDERSPFFGKEYNYDLYTDTIYGYYIDPAWDSFGSETLYVKILYADYNLGFTVLEFIGEWNDTLYNDIMTLKRNVIEIMLAEGINKFIIIGESIFNFHGSDDSYYEEWFDEIEDGWIAAINFPEFIQHEFKKYHLDSYINMGGTLQIPQWRTLVPARFFELVNALIQRRLS